MESPKILFLDIETAPIRAWVWSVFKPIISVDQIDQDWYMLCYAAKWMDEDEVMYDAIWEHKKAFKRKKTDDLHVVDSLWCLLDLADIVIAHNGDRFDVAKIKAKFFEHGYLPPSPFKTVDTLKVGRSQFGFTTNRLNYIAKLRNKGEKLKTDFDLWLDVMNGVPEQCNRMLDYNIQDVALLEEIYKDMRPWITNHPNVGVYGDGKRTVCPTCGSGNIQYRGYAHTSAGKYRKFVCNECGHWGRHATNELPLEARRGLARNVSK